jgi:hypothetical protein
MMAMKRTYSECIYEYAVPFIITCQKLQHPLSSKYGTPATEHCLNRTEFSVRVLVSLPIEKKLPKSVQRISQ